MTGPLRFHFLGRSDDLPVAGGWNDPKHDKLWLYNLHYFDDLIAEGASTRLDWHRALIERWIFENPPTVGNGWEPYPTSLRIVNWIKWILGGAPASKDMLVSLAMQARWLRKRLEWHLLGNHLFANAKALIFAGLFFDSGEARSWLETGLGILSRELPEQLLADGGHFERSPMYHAISMEDLLDLLNASRAWSNIVPLSFTRAWSRAAELGYAWLEGMSHPDGEVSFFNDAAPGIAPSIKTLGAYAARLDAPPGVDAKAGQIRCREWAASGYLRLDAPEAAVILDAAPIGPDYLPGHAHADTLSFEMSLFGERVIVNRGTSRYGIGPERLLERETRSHSTVEIDGESSSEVWGGFRVARRAYPFDLDITQDSSQIVVACSHNGYRRLAGGPVHRRRWSLKERQLRVVDSVVGGDHVAVARYIFHPHIAIEPEKGDIWKLHSPRVSARLRVQLGRALVMPAEYAPSFGKTYPTTCLVVHLENGQAAVEIEW